MRLANENEVVLLTNYSAAFAIAFLHSCTIQLAIASRFLISTFVGIAPNQIWLILKQTQFWLSHSVSLPARYLTLRKPMS